MYTWIIFSKNMGASDPAQAESIQAAVSAAQALIQLIAENDYPYPAGLEIRDDSGALVGGGSWDASGSFKAGIPEADADKFAVRILDPAGGYLYSSGFAFDTLEAAKAALEDQRGSLPAGDLEYDYEILDRASKIVASGKVKSSAYVPDETHFAIHIRDGILNKDVVFSDYTFDTPEAAAQALDGEKIRLQSENPAGGIYDWDIRKAGKVVASGRWLYGDYPGGSGNSSDGSGAGLRGLIPILILGGIVILAWIILSRAAGKPADVPNPVKALEGK